jgi:hypothetical protein
LFTINDDDSIDGIGDLPVTSKWSEFSIRAINCYNALIESVEYLSTNETTMFYDSKGFKVE